VADVKDDTADDPRADAFLREVARIDDLPPPTGELPPGARLGRFSIVSRLGAGAMGAVYEAKDETLGRTVAIKLMRRTSDEARRRFVQEARAAAAVSHPNLITVHEVGEADGRAFIVMEHIRGKTLRAYLAGNPPKPEAQRIMRDIARGVAAAHAAGIVHRDLKPDNVMIAADGTVKVVDFGIARVASGSGDGGALAVTDMAMTGTGAIVGTPSYMSPEQAMGQPVDARSDVYSFGVVAYELLTGTRPGPDPAPPAVSPELDSVVTRCLAARRDERFADAGEVRDALDGIIPPLVRSARRRGGRSIIAFATVVSLLLIVAGSTIAVWRKQRLRGHRIHAYSGPLAAAPGVHSTNPAALAAYKGAFQSLRDAMYPEAVSGFEKAAELDPGFIEAHLRVGISKRFFFDPDAGRRSFEIAVKNRALLDEHDRLLLDAAEPSAMRDPYDHAESKRRYLAALEKYPRDSELLYWLGWAYSELGEPAELTSLYDKLGAIDPDAAFVWSGRALSYMYQGDRRGAREAAVECRRLSPTQGGCVGEMVKVFDDTGACGELETALRGLAMASPDNAQVNVDLARVLLAQERPIPAVRDLFAKARAIAPESDREYIEVEEHLALAEFSGDFETAERLYREKMPWGSTTAAMLVAIAQETGRPDAARAVAEEYFARSAAMPPNNGSSDMNLFHDETGVMLAALARGGAITSDERERRRAEWLRDLDTHIGGVYKRQIWAQAYAKGTYTPEEAAIAVAAMPSDLPPYYWFTFIYGPIGRTLELAGRHADALPYLDRATHRCLKRDPVYSDYLGRAQEGLGNKAAACEAYATVVRRWGNAKPRSVSAEHARERHTALSCDSI
jgi:eukaryotic-like serine/threonine-protein kinase